MMAYGVYQAAKALGLTVGHDISVSGFDNTQNSLSIFQPKLTTADPNMALWSDMIADSIVQRIEGTEPITNQTIFVPSEIVMGQSVKLNA